MELRGMTKKTHWTITTYSWISDFNIKSAKKVIKKRKNNQTQFL